jgi:hypothetical protein
MGFGKTCGIHGQQHIGRAVCPLVANALKQLVLLTLDAIDLDSRIAGEVGIQGFIRLVMAGRIEIEHFVFSKGRSRKGKDTQGNQGGFEFHREDSSERKA